MIDYKKRLDNKIKEYKIIEDRINYLTDNLIDLFCLITKNMSDKEVEEITGIHYSNVNSIRNKRLRPKIKSLISYIRLFVDHEEE